MINNIGIRLFAANIVMMVYVVMNRAKAASLAFSCDNTNACIPSGSVVTCTCTVEDEDGGRSTLWDGTAFMSQCPSSLDRIILVHAQFPARQPFECGNRISAVPISQELQNYTSNATITVNTSNNGSSIRCGRAGLSAEGMKVLNVGEIPPSPKNLSIPPESLTRGRFSLTWTEPIIVFGGVGCYQATVHSDQSGDVARLCGHITAPSGEATPVRNFSDWITEGQTCNFSMTTVTGDNCNFTSTPSQEATIVLQGPDQTMVEQIVLDNPVYVNNQLRVIDISFVYSQESPVMIINGVTSITTNFSITYSYSASGSCATIVPLSCNQQRWCNYTLPLDNCPTMTASSGIFSVVPLNIIGRGTTRNSDLIANRNPLFNVSDQNNINYPSKRLQLRFQTAFTMARCFIKYGLVTSTECSNFNLNTTIVSTNSDVIVVNVTLLQSGRYCYRINCTITPNSMSLTPIAQGMFEYQPDMITTTTESASFPLWVIAIIIAILILAVVVVVITLAIIWKIKSVAKGNREYHEGRGGKEESGVPEYEDITQPAADSETTFEMGENVAYGPVLKNRAR